MLKIGNVYGHGFNLSRIEYIRSLGFSIREPASHFPGSQVLRFVDFSTGPSLEFIEVTNEPDYLDFVPQGMVPFCPGINLLIPPDSPKGLSAYQTELQDWGPNTRHVNYDGSQAENQPGWNYLNFAKPIVKDTFTYLTELEEPRPGRKPAGRHPNSVARVLGIVFNLPAGQLSSLAMLAEADPQSGNLSIGGVQVWSSDEIAPDWDFGDKKFPLIAIALKTNNPDRSLEFFRSLGVPLTRFFSQPAAHMQMPESSWDLIVTG
ncbi:MAG: hypothetical protein R3335_05190 [Anaerolineales bacterium]|nr:hypothetical protein [Anaerolineales bacterium]